MYADVAQYVRTCDTFQRLKGPRKYDTVMKIPRSSLFDVFSTDFAGSVLKMASGNQLLLICAEHPTGWPIIKPIKRATAGDFKSFMEKRVMFPFGATRTVVNDNAIFFRAQLLRDFMSRRGTRWRAVLAYAPVSNGKAERMVKTMKKGVARLLQDRGDEWDQVVSAVAFGYCRRRRRDGISQFGLSYGVQPRLLPSIFGVTTSSDGDIYHKTELMALLGPRAVDARKKDRNRYSDVVKIETFAVGDKVLIAYRATLTAPKRKASQPKMCGPCKIARANHPRSDLFSKSGRHTSTSIHAWSFIRYQSRLLS